MLSYLVVFHFPNETRFLGAGRRKGGTLETRATTNLRLPNQNYVVSLPYPRKIRFDLSQGFRKYRPRTFRRSARTRVSGRVARRRDWFRPMASAVSALSSIVANGHQILPPFAPPPLIMPCGGFSLTTVGSQPRRLAPFRRRPRLRLTRSLRSFRAWLCVQASRFAALPTGP